MQYKSVTLLSLFALGAIATPTPQTVESVPDDPVPAGGGAGMAANDVVEANSPATLDSKKSWDFSYNEGAKYNPLSDGMTDCYVKNQIGINDVQKGALTACYEASNKLWGSQDCGLLTWTIAKDGGHWKNSQDCWGQNKHCIESAISAGFGDVECYSGPNTGSGLNLDRCKVTYSYTTPLDASQILDPKKNPAIQ